MASASTAATWNNAGTDWLTGTNWTGGTGPGGIPSSTDIATFATLGTQPNLSASTSVGGVSLATATGGWNITGAPTAVLTVGGTTAAMESNALDTGTLTFGLNLKLLSGNNETWSFGLLSDVAASKTFIVNFSGGIDLDGQTLIIADNRASTAPATSTGTINLSGAISSTAAAAAGNITYQGQSSGRDLFTVTNSNSYVGLTKISASTVTVSTIAASGVNSPFGNSGTIQIGGNGSNAILAYTGSGATSDRPFVFNSAGTPTLNDNGAGALNLTSTGAAVATGGTAAVTVTFGGSNALVSTFAGLIANSGTGTTNVTKNGTVSASTWALTNANSSFTGTVTVATGVLQVDTVALNGLNSDLGAGTSVVLGTGNNTGTLKYVGSGGSTNRSFSLNTSAGGLGGGAFNSSGTGALMLTNTGPITNAFTGIKNFFLTGTNTNNNTVAGSFQDSTSTAQSLSIVKQGGSTWLLTGTSTYTGTTTLQAGVLGLASDAAINGGSGGVIISGGGTIQFDNYTSTLDPSTFTFSGGAPLSLGASTGSASTLSTPISGGNPFVFIGPGTLNVSDNNSYNSTTTISGGVLAVSSLNAGGSAASGIGSSSNAATNLVLSGGTLQYTGNPTATTDRLFTVTPAGGAIDSSGAGTLTFNNGAAITVTDAASRAVTTESTATPLLTLANVADLAVGMTVSGTNIAAGTTIVAINNGAQTITLSQPPTATSVSDTLNFSAANRVLTLTGNNTGANTMGNILTNSPNATLGLTKAGAGSWILSGVNTYTGNTHVTGGALTLASTGKIASANLTVDATTTANINGLLTGTPSVTANGQVTFGAADGVNAVASGQILTRNVGAVTVGSTGAVTLAAATDHTARQLLVTGSITNTAGLIDLSNNDLVDVAPADAASIVTQLKAGFNAGAGYWNGPTGIVSTKAAGDTRFLTTLGYRQTDGTISFDGQTPANGATLVKYTYYGDANLDGTVDGADYQQIDMGFGTNATGWFNGDFNYDGVINGSDFALIDNTFNQITATSASPLAIIASPAAVSSVPEPTAIGLLGLSTITLLTRRRREA